jgi:hypothetical protein
MYKKKKKKKKPKKKPKKIHGQGKGVCGTFQDCQQNRLVREL